MKKQLLIVVCLISVGTSALAQSKIKDGTVTGSSSLPNSNAILELESNRRGLLLPRVALSSTTLATPMSAHVEGITIYNTASVGDVTPGYYYNNGTKWLRITDASAADLSKDAWVDDNANTMVKLGTQSNGTSPRTAGTELVVTDGGNVGMGTTTPANRLDVNGKANVRNLTGTDIPATDVIVTADATTGELKDAGTRTQFLASAGADTTNDAFVNNTTGTRVELGTRSTGTARAAGTEFVITDGGNVGMGTTAPANRLDVNGKANVRNLTGTDIPATDVIVTADATTGELKDAGTRTQFLASAGADTTNDAWVNGTGLVQLGTQSNGTARAANTQFVALDNGRVGIGTSAPGTKLDMTGAITTRETALAIVSNAVTVGIDTGLVRLTGTATATVTVTATAPPNSGKRLVIYNTTTGGFDAQLGGIIIPNGQAVEFVYSNGGWRGTTGGASDLTDDPWRNVAGRVELGTQSDGTTARTANTQFVALDNGRVGLGTTVPDARIRMALPAIVAATTAIEPYLKLSTGSDNQRTLTVSPMHGSFNFPSVMNSVLGSGVLESNFGVLIEGPSLGNVVLQIKNNEPTDGLYVVNDAGDKIGLTVRPDAERVGIATPVPQSTLDVNGKTRVRDLTGTDAATDVIVTASATTGELKEAGTRTQFLVNAGADTTNDAFVNNTTGTRVELGTRSTGTARAAGTEFVITDGGNVGMGTTAPANRLDVNGKANVRNLTGTGVPATDVIVTADATTGELKEAGTRTQFLVNAGADTSNDAWVNGAGQVRLGTQSNGTTARGAGTEFVATDAGDIGIGTAAPASKLHVLGGKMIIAANANPANVLSNSYHDIAGSAGTTEAALLRLVNTSTAAVNNTAILGFNAYNGAGSTWGIGSVQTSALASSSDFNVFYSSGGGYFRYMTVKSSTGLVGINTTAPDQRLSVNGNASKTGGTAWAVFSDRRVKKDIRPFTDGLEKIMQIKPVFFKYSGIGGIEPSAKDEIGIIAQEMQKIAPYTITESEKEVDGSGKGLLQYDRADAVTYMLVNAVQEQQNQLIEKDATIKKLTARLEALEKLVTEKLEGGK